MQTELPLRTTEIFLEIYVFWILQAGNQAFNQTIQKPI